MGLHPLDCPPNLDVLNNATLVTGDVLIPAQARTTPIRAIELLFTQHHSIESVFGPIDELALVANGIEVDREPRR